MSVDPYRGSELYGQSCAKCHVLFRRGDHIGPDLTAYERHDASRMILHIVHPSLEIREGFETWTAITVDGRVITGLLVDQDANMIVLRSVDGQNISLARDQLEDLVRGRKSLMPEGLLNELSEQEIRDLFAYLRLSQPLDE